MKPTLRQQFERLAQTVGEAFELLAQRGFHGGAG